MEFEPWPKIARLNRDMVITEKIDGTNGAVLIEEVPLEGWEQHDATSAVHLDGRVYLVGAQSRKRLITPEQDNHGFARWVADNAGPLVEILGPGRHFGEWWGSGIQRGYGLPKGEKRFSLFNVKRYAPLLAIAETETEPERLRLPGLDIVPVLHVGLFSQKEIEYQLYMLATMGSAAAPGFKSPEGIVIFHTALNGVFKVTLKDDEKPKSKSLFAA